MKEEYKSVCDTCGRKTWYETEQQCHCEYPKKKTCDTCGHSEEVEPLKMERCKGTLRIFNNSQLDTRFDYAYKHNLRVEVTNKEGWENYTGYGSRTEGRKNRFYVGKSTGWKPVYLMILNKNSIGGSAICSKGIESVRVL